MAVFSVVIFVLLSSQDGFKLKWTKDITGKEHAPAIYNGVFSTIAFLIGGGASILSGFLGMKIAVYVTALCAAGRQRAWASCRAGAWAAGTPMDASRWR